MKVLIAVVLLGSLHGAAIAAEASRSIDSRHHFLVVASADVRLYEVTAILRLTDDIDASYLLVRDEGATDFVMWHRWTFKDQVSIYRINDVKDRTFVQLSSKMQFASKTRLETLAEARRNFEAGFPPTIFKLETNGGQWEGIENEWEDPRRARQLRHDLRQTVDFSLLEAIERMRGTLLGTSEAGPFSDLLTHFFLYDADSEVDLPEGVKTVDADPDCDFDERFGFPCSDEQNEKLEKAKKAGTSLKRY